MSVQKSHDLGVARKQLLAVLRRVVSDKDITLGEVEQLHKDVSVARTYSGLVGTIFQLLDLSKEELAESFPRFLGDKDNYRVRVRVQGKTVLNAGNLRTVEGELVVEYGGAEVIIRGYDAKYRDMYFPVAIATSIWGEKAFLSALTRVDTLTGHLNLRGFKEKFSQELNRAKRQNHSLAILFFDLDGFKAINDNQGHDEGDKVLIGVAKIFDQLTRTRRGVDVVARVGGDEFIILLPELCLKKAAARAEKIRQAIDDTFRGKYPTPLSVSVGVSGYPETAKSTVWLRRKADEACRQAKKAGKNQVVVTQGLKKLVSG